MIETQLILQTEMLTRFNRTQFSFQEVYTITSYYSDGTSISETKLGLTHFYNRISF